MRKTFLPLVAATLTSLTPAAEARQIPTQLTATAEMKVGIPSCERAARLYRQYGISSLMEQKRREAREHVFTAFGIPPSPEPLPPFLDRIARRHTFCEITRKRDWYLRQQFSSPNAR